MCKGAGEGEGTGEGRHVQEREREREREDMCGCCRGRACAAGTEGEGEGERGHVCAAQRVCYTFGLSIHLPYADLFGLPPFPSRSQSPHQVLTVIFVPLYRNLLYHCTIRSSPSTSFSSTIIS